MDNIIPLSRNKDESFPPVTCDNPDGCENTTEDWEADGWYSVQFGFDQNENNKLFCSALHAAYFFQSRSQND